MLDKSNKKLLLRGINHSWNDSVNVELGNVYVNLRRKEYPTINNNIAMERGEDLTSREKRPHIL